MKISVDTFDYLGRSIDSTINSYDKLAEQIVSLAKNNTLYSNKGTYSEEAMIRLNISKTSEVIKTLIQQSYTVCLYDENKELIGCGLLTYQDSRYFAKSLHIRNDYRGKGYAKLICNMREEYLKNIGINEIFIESLKFPETLEFHRSRGFYEVPIYKELKNTILMKKDLYIAK